MSPLVSIGIPCFNSARWLRPAIESALAQTWPEKEVIVVDDGSTDDSAAIAASFGERVRLIRTQNRGGNHARNEALRAARGEWLQFLDADDWLEPAKIAQQLAETNGGAEADIIYSPVHIETTTSEGSQRTLSEIDLRLDLFAQWIAWQIPQTGGCLWRRSALEALGGWKENQPCCQEHELYLRALQAGQRFVFAPTPHAVYRIWSEETVCRKDPRLVVRVRTQLIDDLQAWMKARGLWTEGHRQVAGRACFEMARTMAKHDLRAGARYYRERQARQLVHLDGPAAPSSYRMAIHALGFSGAEILARALR